MYIMSFSYFFKSFNFLKNIYKENVASNYTLCIKRTNILVCKRSAFKPQMRLLMGRQVLVDVFKLIERFIFFHIYFLIVYVTLLIFTCFYLLFN